MNDVGLHLVLESVLGASLLLLGAAYWKLQTKKELAKAALEDTARSVQDQLGSLKSQMLILGQAVQPLTAAMAAVLVKQLTHFHAPNTDALLAKVGPPSTLTRAEEKQLAEAMDTRMIDGDITLLERNSAQLLLLFIERSRLEDNGSIEGMDLALVGVPRAHE
jgi:hypothetical protein